MELSNKVEKNQEELQSMKVGGASEGEGDQ